MRALRSTTFLSLAATLAWLGSSVTPAQAAAPGACQYSDASAEACSSSYGCEEQCSAPADPYCGECAPSDCAPRWTFAAEAIAVQRSTTRSQTLFADGFSSTSNELLNSKNMDFPVAFGYRLSAIRHIDCVWGVEVAYFQLDGFESERDLPGTSYMVTDMDGPSIAMSNAHARYTSELYNGELNVRYQSTCWLTLLAGFRAVELDERYLASGTDIRSGSPATFHSNAFNHLYGFQLGADAEVYNMGGPLVISGLCRAGIYGNSAIVNISEPSPNGGHESLADEHDQASFLGEAGIVATYALTKRLAFRASCEAMWLTGVALAPEQLSSTDFTGNIAVANTGGTVFYYGGGLGLEYRF